MSLVWSGEPFSAKHDAKTGSVVVTTPEGNEHQLNLAAAASLLHDISRAISRAKSQVRADAVRKVLRARKPAEPDDSLAQGHRPMPAGGKLLKIDGGKRGHVDE